MGTVPTPHAWVAGELAIAANLQTLTAALAFLLDPPKGKATRAAAQSIPNGTDTRITFTVETYDNDSIVDIAGAATRCTIRTAGKYDILGSVSYAGNATGTRNTQIWVNGTTLNPVSWMPGLATSNAAQVMQQGVQLAVGDYIELDVYQTSGGALNVSLCELAVKWVGS